MKQFDYYVMTTKTYGTFQKFMKLNFDKEGRNKANSISSLIELTVFSSDGSLVLKGDFQIQKNYGSSSEIILRCLNHEHKNFDGSYVEGSRFLSYSIAYKETDGDVYFYLYTHQQGQYIGINISDIGSLGEFIFPQSDDDYLPSSQSSQLTFPIMLTSNVIQSTINKSEVDKSSIKSSTFEKSKLYKVNIFGENNTCCKYTFRLRKIVKFKWKKTNYRLSFCVRIDGLNFGLYSVSEPNAMVFNITELPQYYTLDYCFREVNGYYCLYLFLEGGSANTAFGTLMKDDVGNQEVEMTFLDSYDSDYSTGTEIAKDEVRNYGTFAQRPTNADIGLNFFCTDKQTTEGATDGIMIFHKGSDVWIDALGRVVS